nr:synaptobrevin, longin-like domain protein [Tanacetum cinerariifolium]
MAKLAFCDYHNMVAILEKTEHNTDFHQIVDFLEASHIRYALTVRSTIYVSHIRQFWSTARVETTDGETKILAKVNGRQRTVSASSIRRHLKLNDEEGISTLLENKLFENPSLMGYNILPNQRFSFHKGQFSHQWKILIHTIMQCLSTKSTSFNEFSSNIATALVCLATNITYNFSNMTFDGMVRNVKNETAFPTGDARYGEAFPTITRLDVGQDRENIAKTSAMPHEASPRVTSLGGGEGKKRVQSQDLEITQLKTKVMTLKDNEKRREGFAQEDAPNTRGEGMDQGDDLLVGDTVKDIDKSADKGSDSTDDTTNVLGTLGAENILASGGLRLVFTTTSLSVATASTVVSPVVATASGSFPTVVIFTTASVATPTTRVTRSSREPSKEKVLEQMSAQLARYLEAKFAQEDQIIREQAGRDYEIARIHAERELAMMIAKLDRSNEMVAKYLSEYEQAKAVLSHDEKVELIDELLMYQRYLAQIKKYQAQQNKPATKTERRDLYMSILKSNAGWKAKDFKGMTFEQIEEKFIPVWEKMQDFVPMNSNLESERLKRPGIQLGKESFKKLKIAKASGTKPSQEQQSEEPKELSEEELKKMIELVPVEELYIEALQVELKRLYEPDSRDPLWSLQRYMHDPLVWRLYDTCGVHHVSTGRGHEIFMLVEKDYLLTKGLTTLMLCNKL